MRRPWEYWPLQRPHHQDSPVEGIIQARKERQDQKGEPPDSQVEDFIQGSPYQDKPVEGNIQGRQDRQDLKGEPPDSQVEEFLQRWTIGSILKPTQI